MNDFSVDRNRLYLQQRPGGSGSGGSFLDRCAFTLWIDAFLLI
jgi:hypothetical protein